MCPEIKSYEDAENFYRKDVDECVALLRSGEYPRESLHNDAPVGAESSEALAMMSSFQSAVNQEGRYAFLSK